MLKYKELNDGKTEKEEALRKKRLKFLGFVVCCTLCTVIVIVSVTVAVLSNSALNPRADVFTLTPDMQNLLTRHNSYRARHGSPALKWDQGLANDASVNAVSCIFSHDNVQGKGQGENLFAGCSITMQAAIQQATDNWYMEIGAYSFANPGFSSGTGHFTQLVWKGTTSIGCAAQFCKTLGGTSMKEALFVDCRYSPQGNMLGQFAQNVLRPSTV